MKGKVRIRKGEGPGGKGAAQSAFHVSRFTFHVSRRPLAFTLIELLVVIAIMGLLAAIALPAVNKLKPNAMAAGTQKLLTDVGRARQLAIAHRTTVYMVFVWPGYWTDGSQPYSAAFKALSGTNLLAAQKLADKQAVGYTFISLRSIGDQPGRNTVRYLDSWRTLPEGTFIPWQKFFGPSFTVTNFVNGTQVLLPVAPFNSTNFFPFPLESAPSSGGAWVNLPFIAFNYLGQLVDANGLPTRQNELIPLSQGSVLVARDATKTPVPPDPTGASVPAAVTIEKPVGNTTNTFNIINIDWLSGRARVERQEVL